MTKSNSNNQVSHKVKLPFKAYTGGDEPYIFVSYKHKDADIVYPIIKQFHDVGFNIWYDEGLPYGENFDIVIPNKIEGAALFLNFITHECMAGANDSEDYMIKESDIAQYLGVPILAIYPQPDVRLKGYYLTNYLKKQSVYRHEYGSNEEMFIDLCVEIFKSKGIEPNPMQESEPAIEKTPNDSPTIDTQSFEDKSETYVFVSYSRSDSKRVGPELKRLQDYGCDIRSDESIESGNGWLESVYDAIQNSSLFVVFMSENTFKSPPRMHNEVTYALEKNIPVLPVYLEETELNSGLELRLSSMRSIHKYKMSDIGYVDVLRESFESYGIKMGPKGNMNIFGIEYSFRNPDCPIYNLAEQIYPYWRKNDADFSSLSDEEYFYYERTAINALCLVKASGRNFYFTDSNGLHLDLSGANSWETFKEAQILFIAIMKDLGWKDGKYDYENRTIPLAEFGGSLASDFQERHMQRIIDSVRKSEL